MFCIDNIHTWSVGENINGDLKMQTYYSPI